jgi:hypothetical protein
MSVQIEHYSRTGAGVGMCVALAVTATQAYLDVSSDAQIGPGVKGGRKLRIYADGASDVYYFFAPSSTQTIDDTATGSTNPARQCDCIAKGTAIEVRPPRVRGVIWPFLFYKCGGSGTATLRVSLLSQDEHMYGT